MLLSTVLAFSLWAAPAPDDITAATRAWQKGRLKRLRPTTDGSPWSGSDGSRKDRTARAPTGRPRWSSPRTLRRTSGPLCARDRRSPSSPPRACPSPGPEKRFSGGAVQTDEEGRAEPDVVQVGRFRFQLIARGSRVGVRIKDPDARARKEFKGIPAFPPSAHWRIVARWEPANPPTEIAVPNVLGEVDRSPSPGTAVFTVDGKEYRLTPVLEEGSPDLFFVFGDETNRTETYGAGRFLYAAPAKDGTVVLDFNRAYNPPCAFSAFATCPLPPKQNRLALRVEAGEKRLPGH